MSDSDDETTAFLPKHNRTGKSLLSQESEEDDSSTTLSDEDNFENSATPLLNPSADGASGTDKSYGDVFQEISSSVAENASASEKDNERFPRSSSGAEGLSEDNEYYDSLQQEISSSSAEHLGRIDKAYDALLYHERGANVSSSGDSKKSVSTESSAEFHYITEEHTDEAGNVDYVEVDINTSIEEKDIAKVMKKLCRNHYTALSCEGDSMLSTCKALFQRDYHCEVIDNFGGYLSNHYPCRIIVPVAKLSRTASSERTRPMEFDVQQYTERVRASATARIRKRFVVPAILFLDKFICRSGALNTRKTAVFETARKMTSPKEIEITASTVMQVARTPSYMKKLRKADAQIIRDLKIGHICDLMVKDKKTFTGISISTSEMINQDIYSDCLIERMPYPGCTFFKKYKPAKYEADSLVFDWTRSDVTVKLMFSEEPSHAFPFICWSRYKEWDLMTLAQNYLKMMLYYLATGSGGLLVHCLSGWDRTPLFISMLRASLWADGLIHESLHYNEMAYLMLAYDWYLFGHDFPKRLRKNQEILHFCFYILQHIVSDEFSITKIFHELSPELKRGRTFPDHQPKRRNQLETLSKYVLGLYDENITKKRNEYM